MKFQKKNLKGSLKHGEKLCGIHGTNITILLEKKLLNDLRNRKLFLIDSK